MIHRFPKNIERCKEWAQQCYCPNIAQVEPEVCRRTNKLCSAHLNPTQYIDKHLIDIAKPSKFNCFNACKIGTPTTLVFEFEKIKTFPSQIKENTNVMNNQKRFKKSDENNRHNSFITEIPQNSIHLIDHNYYAPPVTDTINIYDKTRINEHLFEHNNFFQVSDTNVTNIHCDKKKGNQHLLEHNYFLPVLKYKLKREISPSDDTKKGEKLDVQSPVTYTILPGVRLNSNVYMDNLNHRYYKHSSRKHVIYLVCENQKNKTEFCPVLATISVNMEDNRIKTSGPHNHLPRQVDIPMVNLRRAIGLQAIASESLSTPIKQLYNKEIIMNPEGAKNYSLSQSQLCARRMRRRRKISSIIQDK